MSGWIIEKNFLNIQEQSDLMQSIDSCPWSTELGRRVQQFGYCYDYSTRRISSSRETAAIPTWGNKLVDRMIARGIATQSFDQVIVNEYLPGQGISPHIDSISSFGNEIVSVSLGSSCIMTFSNPRRGEQCDILLDPGDLLLLRDEARFQWRHQIRSRKSDRWQGRVMKRSRRLSVTFRKVLLNVTM